VQRGMGAAAGEPAERRLQYRVGINVGDVLADAPLPEGFASLPVNLRERRIAYKHAISDRVEIYSQYATRRARTQPYADIASSRRYLDNVKACRGPRDHHGDGAQRPRAVRAKTQDDIAAPVG